MWFGEPHPFPERGSATGLSASGQQSCKGWPCRIRIKKQDGVAWTGFPRLGQVGDCCEQGDVPSNLETWGSHRGFAKLFQSSGTWHRVLSGYLPTLRRLLVPSPSGSSSPRTSCRTETIHRNIRKYSPQRLNVTWQKSWTFELRVP